jgi:hypothetical protein
MPTRTEAAVVAVFGNISDAQAAADELTANAFAGDHIHIASEGTESNPAIEALQSHSAGHFARDMETWCKSTFGRNQKTERERYENAALDGHVLLGLNTPEQMVDTASDILNHHSPVDLAQDDSVAQFTESGCVANSEGQAKRLRILRVAKQRQDQR